MMAGRPSKHTPALEEDLLAILREGNTRKAACGYVGISEDTFGRWRKQNQDFADAIEKAEAEALIASIGRIRQAAIGGQVVAEKVTVKEHKDGSIITTTERAFTRPEWTADAWFAERKYPGDWGRKDRIDLTVVEREVARARDLFDLSDEETERLKALAVADAEAIVKGKRDGTGTVH